MSEVADRADLWSQIIAPVEEEYGGPRMLDLPAGIEPQPGPQAAFLRSGADIAVLGGAAGGGKMLALGTVLPTPYGWTTVGDVVAGELLFSERGEPVEVLAVHPIAERPESYRLVFDDGAEVTACSDHLWLTFDAAELDALTRREPGWRARRRARRPSRAVAGRQYLIERNRTDNPAITLPPPTGTVRSTAEIHSTLLTVAGRRNHAIPVSAPLDLPDRALPLDPYILGVWLGDGSTASGSVTTTDSEIVEALAEAGYQPREVRHRADRAPTYGTRGLRGVLRDIGVLGDKHIPVDYLRASASQRLALLQGLMDTDGYASERGRCEFTTTKIALARDVHELVVGLGLKTRITEGRAKLDGRDCGPKYRLNFRAPFHVFRLARKRERQNLAVRRTTRFRYIVSCEATEPVPMRCITVANPTGLFLCGHAMVPTHNTTALLIEPLRYRHRRRFNPVFFRRTFARILQPGGMWDEAARFYSDLARPNRADLTWTFEDGARVQFAHLQHADDRFNYKGAQIALLCFDQLEEFVESQFWYLLSRNRSLVPGVRGYVRATCNPVPEHDETGGWLHRLLSWWIDEATGYPILERSGVLRWFVRDGDEIIWADTKKELLAEHPELPPTSLTFIPAKLEDNPILEELDPNYRGRLLSMPRVERERLLAGNWKVRPAAGEYFRKEWFNVVDAVPAEVAGVRAWDLAASRKGDYTVGLLVLRDRNGRFTVADMVRIRERAHSVRRAIKTTAARDGTDVRIRLPQDPGQAGKAQARDLVAMLAGYRVSARTVTGSKSTRAEPASAQAEAGNIDIVRAPWNDVFFSEIEAFQGDGRGRDDIVDALSDAIDEHSNPRRRFGGLFPGMDMDAIEREVERKRLKHEQERAERKKIHPKA